jgi:hypothetical protein
MLMNARKKALACRKTEASHCVRSVLSREWDTRVDLLIVGDELNMARLETL